MIKVPDYIFRIIPYSLFFIPLFISCHRNYPKEENKLSDKEVNEHMMNANKIIVDHESKDIEEFITRQKWQMTMSGTGLRMQVYEEGSGKMPDSKSNVTISYKIFLLDGTLCYSYDDQHPLKLSLGSNLTTRGLEEGLMKMKEGSKARLLVPSHLAYGMIGDQNKIPSASALYYDVHLIKVE